MPLPRTIVVGTDFSEQAEKATREAIELAKKLDARVHLVHGWTPPPGLEPIGLPAPFTGSLLDQLEATAKAAMRQALERHRPSEVPLDGTVLLDDPRDAITRLAEKLKADLVVVGTHGRRGLKRVLLGSVAESVVRTAPCAVLVIR